MSTKEEETDQEDSDQEELEPQFAWGKSAPPSKTCNAWMKVGKRHCRNSAGYLTQHPGYGRCWRHGGKAWGEGHARLPAPAKLYDLALKYFEDSDVFDLRREIAVAKAAIAQIEVDDEDPNLHVPALNMLLNTIGKLVQTLHEIEVGRKYVIRVSDVHGIIEKVLALMLQYIPDPGDRRELGYKIRHELDVPGVFELPPANWKYSDEHSEAQADSPKVAKEKARNKPIEKTDLMHYLDEGLPDAPS